MKSVAELKAIFEKNKGEVSIREDNHNKIQVEVGMATCGIAAGAREIMHALVAEIAEKNLHDVVVSQMGCMGICQYEPIVTVSVPGKEKVTYVKVTPEKAQEIVDKHVAGGNVVTEYTIGANAQ